MRSSNASGKLFQMFESVKNIIDPTIKRVGGIPPKLRTIAFDIVVGEAVGGPLCAATRSDGVNLDWAPILSTIPMMTRYYLHI